MSVQHPVLLVFAALVWAGLLGGYLYLARQRGRALAAVGLTSTVSRRAAVRRHAPWVLLLAALALLLVGIARPQATVKVPRATGTVILAFDVSNSMTAADVEPSRLGVAQRAAAGFVRQQPDSVEIGVVAFDQGALTTKPPTRDHDQALAAITALHPAGGTSLGAAILASLGAIVGHPVTLPAADASPPALGYWGSATIVLLSDGEDTGGPDAVAAAELAADAGVHIDTIGVGTTDGATITVDGYQVATALDEDLLSQIAQTTTGLYHRAGDARALDSVYRSLDLRITAKPELVELTGAAVVAALILLTVGGLLMVTWYGRIL